MRGFMVILAVVGLAPVVGCGSGAAQGAATDATAAANVSTTTVDPALARVAGRYAHYDVVAYQSSDMKTLIISYGFTDMDVKDGALVATESFCHSEHRSDLPITTQMSDAATSAIKPIPTKVTVSTKDGKLRIVRPRSPTGIGIHLADPANDPLPNDPNDPRIADDDHDGKPGVTVHIKVTDTLSGDLYIARREIFEYEVTGQDDGSLTGTVSDHSEQLIVGATNDIFKTKAEWLQHPNLDKSPIILKPVDKSWDCTRLMGERPAMFPKTPTVDW